MQQIRAKNAIVKANTATVHTIIQGNLADTDYSTTTGIGNTTDSIGAEAGVVDIRDEFGELLATVKGQATNAERPAGMKNPHLTDGDDFVVYAYDTTIADATVLEDLAAASSWAEADYAGVVIVAYSSALANKFFIMGLNDEALQLGEVYVATK